MVTPTIAIAITHTPWVPKRRAWVNQIGQRLAPTRPSVIPDTDRQGCWPTTLRAWRHLSMQQATHGLVLTDDVLSCRGFMGHLMAAVAQKPDEPVAILTGRQQPTRKADEAGLAWIKCPAYARGGGTVLPRKMIVDFLRFEQRCRPIMDERGQNDDSKLCLFLMAIKADTWITVPSLIEHIGAGESVMGNPVNASGRAAAWFEEDLPSIDWTQGINGEVSIPTGHGKATARTWDHLREELERHPWP